MVDIQSKEVIDKISEELKIQPAMKIPREIMEKIQLSYNVNPDKPLVQLAAATLTNASSAVIFTTSSEKDTFLTGYQVYLIKDVTAVMGDAQITATPWGKSVSGAIWTYLGPTLTVDSTQATREFIPAIKLEPGKPIGIVSSNATAGIDIVAAITFYEVDRQ